MIKISTMEVRKRVGDILNRVALRGDEYLVERKGKPLAVVMPVEKAESIRRAARLRLAIGWPWPTQRGVAPGHRSAGVEVRPPLRVVLDANVIISVLIRPASAPGRILRAAVEGTAVRLVTSDPLLEELRAALQY